MRVQINLASKPFVELGPIFDRLRILMAVLAVAAASLAVWLHFEDTKAEVAQAQVAALRVRESALQRERVQNEARMRQPQNAAALQRSRFLNDLFTRKGFSWTAVMMDLENVLPAGVQVSSIEPQIGADGEVHIRLRVAGDREKAVDLIRNLEHSKRFLEPRLASESMQQQGPQGGFQPVAMNGNGNVEFDILSGYNPLAPKVKPSEEKKGATSKVSIPGSTTKPVARTQSGATPPRMTSPRGAVAGAGRRHSPAAASGPDSRTTPTQPNGSTTGVRIVNPPNGGARR